MTIESKIQQRRMAMDMRNRPATGIVCDYETFLYITRLESGAWEHDKFVPQHFSYDGNTGDTYMGLDVAITKKPNTLIVY